jgi:cobalamin biosynthesis protein CobT
MSEKIGKIYTPEVKKGKETEEVKIDIPREDWESIEIIAKRVGGDFGMEVKLGNPGEGSFFDLETCSITFDPLHIKENLEQAKFVAGHEGAHRAITPGPKEMGLSLEKIRELYSQIGFGYIQNAIEDPAVNDWMRKRFPGLEPYITNVYDEQLKEENVVLSTPEVQRIALRLGYWPRFAQYGSEVIRDWHQKRFSEKLDLAVKIALEKTIEYVRESISIIPDPQKLDQDRKEIVDIARRRFKNNTEWIWPEVKKLVEMDLHTEEQRQMLQEFRQKQKELEQKRKEMEQAQKEGNQQKQKELQKEIEELEKELDPFNGLSEDVKKELQEQIDKAIKEIAEKLDKEIEEKQKQEKETKQKQEELDKEIKDLEEKAKSAIDKEKEELKNRIQEKKAEKLSQEMKQKQVEQELKDIQDALTDFQDGKQIPYPIDKLSQETKQELEKLFNKLPKEKQKELRDKAEKQLEDFEDALNKELEGKLNKDKPESHKERRERERKEKEIEERKRREEKEKKELEKKLEQMRREKMTEYDKVYEEVANIINSLYNRLKRFFLPERHPKWQKGFPTGSRLDLEKAMQAEADPRYLEKIWQRKTIPHKLDYRFSILVDLSGSMEGEKIEETFKGTVVLAEVLEKLGIKYEILGFQDTIIPYKGFREKLDKKIRDNLAIAKREPYNSGVHNQARWNSDGYALEQAYERLKKNLGKNNFLIVLSDGLPVPDPAHSGVRWDLKRIVRNIIKERQVKLIGIGLGPDTDHVKEYYPHSFANLKMKVSEEERRQGQKDFAEAFADLLEDMIRHPEKY